MAGLVKKRGAWSASENQTLITLHAEMGNRWRDIAAAIEGRTEVDVKVRGCLSDWAIYCSPNDVSLVESLVFNAEART